MPAGAPKPVAATKIKPKIIDGIDRTVFWKKLAHHRTHQGVKLFDDNMAIGSEKIAPIVVPHSDIWIVSNNRAQATSKIDRSGGNKREIKSVI